MGRICDQRMLTPSDFPLQMTLVDAVSKEVENQAQGPDRNQTQMTLGRPYQAPESNAGRPLVILSSNPSLVLHFSRPVQDPPDPLARPPLPPVPAPYLGTPAYCSSRGHVFALWFAIHLRVRLFHPAVSAQNISPHRRSDAEMSPSRLFHIQNLCGPAPSKGAFAVRRSIEEGRVPDGNICAITGLIICKKTA